MKYKIKDLNRTLKDDQRGLITIVSIILIIIIITIITLSLSSLTRRELRQSLDEQLSSQALYAAESGVNDAVKAINNNPATGDEISDCNEGLAFTGGSNILGDNIRYTCVLIDKSPESIVTDLTPYAVKTYLLDASVGNIDTLTFTWTNTDDSTVEFPDCDNAEGCLIPSTQWGNRLALLRLRLFAAPTTGGLKRFDFTNALDITAHPYVVNGGLEESGNNQVLEGSCFGTSCRVTIDVGNVNSYYLQAYTYYRDAKLTITGTSSEPGSPDIQFIGAQAEIDATGAAADVVRRIRVNVPLGNFSSNELPVSGVTIGDKLCKRFITNTSGTSDSSACPSF